MKILVCYSGDSSEAIMEKAKERAKQTDASIHLISVLVGGDVDQLKYVEEMKKNLETAQAAIQAEGFVCKTKLMFGGTSAGENIVQYAKEEKVDEIIIGVRKRSKVGKLIFGSAAQHVILEAPCPVLTIK